MLLYFTGSEDEDGVFTIKDVCWAECPIQKPLPELNDDRCSIS